MTRFTSLRSLIAIPVLSLAVAALAACSADTTTPSEDEEVGSAQQAVGSCPSVATLQHCTAQSPCSLNLSGCNYSNAQLPGFYNTGNMSSTLFAGANLAGAVLGGNTAGASFAGANLAGAKLQKNANGANLAGANVTGTTFAGNTSGVSCTNLVIDTLPGSNPPAAGLPTGLSASCLGNVTVTCPAPAGCHQPGVANQGTGWVCQYAAQANGASCNDGNACTSTDTCQSGVCTGASDPCQNGGTCTNNVTSYTCQCPAGYGGTNCDQATGHACANHPCLNEGICIDLVNDGYTCQCAPGILGANCETSTAVCPCAGTPSWDQALSENPITCDLILDLLYANTDAAHSPGVTHQSCGVGGGDFSPADANERAACRGLIVAWAAQGGVTCGAAGLGICHSGVTVPGPGLTYSCTCPPGRGGYNCEIPLDNACDANPCQNGGTCTDYLGGYDCACPSGFVGQNCEATLVTLTCSCGVVVPELPSSFCSDQATGDVYCSFFFCHDGTSTAVSCQ